MNETVAPGEIQGEDLCQSCGLCCSGHLFIWVKLKPVELDPAERLGMQVSRSDPTQRGFSQPCPLWKDVCTIYHSTFYPRACKAYRCKLLKALIAQETSFAEATAVVARAKQLIVEVDPLLPDTPLTNFRERMVAEIEHPEDTAWDPAVYQTFRSKAEKLLGCFADDFGVTDLLESPGGGGYIF